MMRHQRQSVAAAPTHPDPRHSRVPHFEFSEMKCGPPCRTPGCTPPHFSCICHVGFDFGFGLWPLIFRVECTSNSVASLVWPRTEIWRKGYDLTISHYILRGCPEGRLGRTSAVPPILPYILPY